MKYVLLDRTHIPALAAPMTYDDWMQFNHRLDGCLESRSVHWLYSLVSVQGDRSLCLFEAPYTELVREACREACMPFQHVWQTELWLDQDPRSLAQDASLAIAEVKYGPPITKALYEATKQEASQCFQDLSIQHIVSLVSLDGTYSICLFTATSAEDVRSLYRKIGKSFEQVWKVVLIHPEPFA